MKLTAIRQTIRTASLAALLLVPVVGAACGQATTRPAAPARSQSAGGDDWRLRERNELPAAAPDAGVTRISGAQQDWKLLVVCQSSTAG